MSTHNLLTPIRRNQTCGSGLSKSMSNGPAAHPAATAPDSKLDDQMLEGLRVVIESTFERRDWWAALDAKWADDTETSVMLKVTEECNMYEKFVNVTLLGYLNRMSRPSSLKHCEALIAKIEELRAGLIQFLSPVRRCLGEASRVRLTTASNRIDQKLLYALQRLQVALAVLRSETSPTCRQLEFKNDDVSEVEDKKHTTSSPKPLCLPIAASVTSAKLPKCMLKLESKNRAWLSPMEQQIRSVKTGSDVLNGMHQPMDDADV